MSLTKLKRAIAQVRSVNELKLLIAYCEDRRQLVAGRQAQQRIDDQIRRFRSLPDKTVVYASSTIKAIKSKDDRNSDPHLLDLHGKACEIWSVMPRKKNVWFRVGASHYLVRAAQFASVEFTEDPPLSAVIAATGE